MSLDGHIGSSKGEAVERERACFMEGWTHSALMRAVSEQEEDYPQIEKLSDYEMGATFIDTEVKKLDDELGALQEALGDGDLVAQFLEAIRRATKEAAEEGQNMYFFGDKVSEER